MFLQEREKIVNLFLFHLVIMNSRTSQTDSPRNISFTYVPCASSKSQEGVIEIWAYWSSTAFPDYNHNRTLLCDNVRKATSSSGVKGTGILQPLVGYSLCSSSMKFFQLVWDQLLSMRAVKEPKLKRHVFKSLVP